VIRRLLVSTLLVACLAAPAFAVTPAFKYAMMPKALGLTYEEVRFPAADSVEVSGWWFEPAKGKPTVVIAGHGSGTMADLLPSVREFQQRGFGVLTFDYRGFGPGSEPGDTLQNVVFASMWVDDMVGAMHYARLRSGPDRHVFAWGQDLGSPVTVSAAARDRKNCTAFACEGLFATSQDALRTNGTSVVFETVRQHRWIVRGEDEPTSSATLLKVPMLVVLAGKDDVTPPAATREVAVRNRFRVEYWSIPTAGHLGAEKTPGYFDKLCGWFKQWTVYPVGS
jgi:alpha-beta hydrolase superfamily lysophospholipase